MKLLLLPQRKPLRPKNNRVSQNRICGLARLDGQDRFVFLEFHACQADAFDEGFLREEEQDDDGENHQCRRGH